LIWEVLFATKRAGVKRHCFARVIAKLIFLCHLRRVACNGDITFYVAFVITWKIRRYYQNARYLYLDRSRKTALKNVSRLSGVLKTEKAISNLQILILIKR